MTRKIQLLALSALLCASSVARPHAQQPPAAPGAPPAQSAPPQNQNPRPITGAPTVAVIVPVTVKDSRGQLVGDLTRDDFRIFADNVPQKISYFASDPVPISAVVLVDNDLSDRAVKQVQRSLVAVAAGFGPQDETALVKYDQYPNTIVDFSTNNDLLFTQLKRLELDSHPAMNPSDPTTAGPISADSPPIINGQPAPLPTGVPLRVSKHAGSTNCLHDALYAAGQMLKGRGRDRRKIIVLISDGSNSKLNTHTFEETLRSLLIADVSVFSISVTRSVPVGKSIVQHSASELDKYAIQTGGDTYFASKEPDLDRLYKDVTEEARNEYTLAFSPEEVNRSHDYHSIEVRVERPGLNVRARDGYYQSSIAVGR